MISLVWDAAGRAVHAHASARAAGIGVIAVMLLLVLIVEREVLRGYGGAAAGARLRAMAPIVLPLLTALVVILGARFGRFA
jgi:hypothetical protein